LARPPQFSLRNIFVAMFWMSLWGAVFPFSNYWSARVRTMSPDDIPLGIAIAIALFNLMLFCALPFVSLGALFGKARLGCWIGVTVAALVYVVVQLAVPLM
jgi:hypothetical protein